MVRVTDKYYISASRKGFIIIEKVMNPETGKYSFYPQGHGKTLTEVVETVKRVLLMDKIDNNEVLTLHDLYQADKDIHNYINDQITGERKDDV